MKCSNCKSIGSVEAFGAIPVVCARCGGSGVVPGPEDAIAQIAARLREVDARARTEGSDETPEDARPVAVPARGKIKFVPPDFATDASVDVVGGVAGALEAPTQLFEGLPLDETTPDAALKADTDKIPLDLLPFDALEEAAKVLQFGAIKYGAYNWRKGMRWTRLLAATLRHIFSWARGQDRDNETGLPHLAHAVVSLLFLLSYAREGLGKDDRAFTRSSTEDDLPF